MENAKKNEVKVLTTNDIRNHSQNWSLAGDVGLLAHLEKFSEDIYSRTQETQKCFNELVDNYEELYTKVGNVTNEFLALQNCQFVENRVYDEETPTEEKLESKPTPNEADQEKVLLMQYKQAVEVGVKLLDTHFQEVHLPPNSDSDEEDEESTGNSLLWKPKNPYANKKFPLLIGSKEWWADDTVGLGVYEENLDTEKIISDSESDMESIHEVGKKTELSSSSSLENEKIIPTKPTFLESSSEDLFGLDKDDSFQNDILPKENNSLLEEPPIFSPTFEKESHMKPEHLDSPTGENHVSHEEDDMTSNNTTNKPYKVSNAFTQELAAKLASVTGNTENVNNKMKQNLPVEETIEKKTTSDESLFDETDDSSDLFSGNYKSKPVNNKGLFFDADNDDKLFSGSKNLFFDSGSLFENNTLQKPKNEFDDTAKKKDATGPRISDQKVSTIPKKLLTNSLFDDLDDEDTLFATKPSNSKSTHESLPSVSDTPNNTQSATSTDLETSSDGLFNSINNDFLNELVKNKKEKTADSKINDNFKINNKTHTPDETLEQPKTVSSKESSNEPQAEAFDSNPKLFGDVSSSILPQKPKEKKFSLLDPEDDADDLFTSSLADDSLFQSDKNSLPKVVASTNDDDTSLFVDKPRQQDSVSVYSSRSSLFDDESGPKSRLASVFEKDKSSKFEDYLFNDSLFSENNPGKDEEDLFATKPTISVKDKKVSLFDDFDDSDDLFGSSKKVVKEQSLFEEGEVIETGREKRLFEEEREKDVLESKNSSSKKNVSLFDNDLGDDDLFSKSSKETEVLFEGTTTSQEKVEVKPNRVIDNKPNLFEKVKSTENKLFGDDLDDSELFGKSSEVSKPKPPSTLEIKKDDLGLKTKSVGKLNIPDNLKTKFESMAKNISTGQAKPKKDLSEPSVESIAENSVVVDTEEKKVADLDEPFLPVSNLLKCPSKDRVKIPGRRRPQSRRARQEAIRNSGANFLENEIPVEDSKPNKTSSCVDLTQKQIEPVKTTSEPLLSSPVLSNPLSPSTDEEDYFNVPELDTNFEKEDQSIFKSSLFQSSNKSVVDDSPLFDGVPVVIESSPKKEPQLSLEDVEDDSLFGSKTQIKPKTISIFDDDDDENLFNADVEVKSQKEEKNLKKPQHSPGIEKVKKSLFDVEIDDEEDLFGGSSSKSLVTSKPTASEKSNGKTSQSKENENMSFVDPLGLMSKND